MNQQWLIPLFFIGLAILTPDTTLTWIFGIIGAVLVGYGMAMSSKDDK